MSLQTTVYRSSRHPVLAAGWFPSPSFKVSQSELSRAQPSGIATGEHRLAKTAEMKRVQVLEMDRHTARAAEAVPTRNRCGPVVWCPLMHMCIGR